MKWSICILTLPVRHRFLARLLGILRPQLEGYPDIELLVSEHADRGVRYGDAVETLRKEASGEYINLLDDDDVIARDYIKSIHPLLDGADYIGHRFRWSCDGQIIKPWSHSLKNPVLQVNQDVVLRDISHLNPMRRELAMQAAFSGALDADQRWSAGIRKLGIVRTEHFVDKELYWYCQITSVFREAYFANAIPPQVQF